MTNHFKKVVLDTASAPQKQDAPAPHTETSVIDAHGLEKSYGTLHVVKGIDLEVKAGEVFGLLGPNGAGKTTLISLLTGILTPDKGAATVCGYDLAKEVKQIKNVVSLVPQDLTLYQELTGLDNLRFFAQLYHLSKAEVKQRVDEVLDVVELKDWAKKRVSTYSGGMKRRLNLAIGLLNHPKIIFLDEPTVGVDPQSRNHIFECIRQLVQQRGMTVFYTTHYMEEAQALCNRVAIYDHGQIVALGTPHELIRSIDANNLTLTVEDLPDAVLMQLQALPAIKHAEYSEHTLTISATSLSHATAEAIRLLEEQAIAITDMQTQEVNLETVFLKLTGKALRE